MTKPPVIGRFEDRHESTKAYIDYMRPRCVVNLHSIEAIWK